MHTSLLAKYIPLNNISQVEINNFKSTQSFTS